MWKLIAGKMLWWFTSMGYFGILSIWILSQFAPPRFLITFKGVSYRHSKSTLDYRLLGLVRVRLNCVFFFFAFLPFQTTCDYILHKEKRKRYFSQVKLHNRFVKKAEWTTALLCSCFVFKTRPTLGGAEGGAPFRSTWLWEQPISPANTYMWLTHQPHWSSDCGR